MQKRKQGGVFYTPQPIVKFIVETVNYILKNKLGISKGFAEKNVKTLDFATGTGSFLAEVFNVILEQEKSPVFKISTIKDKFLKDIYGFEMMFVPYKP
jgi:predicted helicase